MNYWDASAIVPLLVTETGTALVRQWLADTPSIYTWALTRVEISSAIERRVRERAIATTDRIQALKRLDALAQAWDEITDLMAVRHHALRCLAQHSLRAADALQLAAAHLLSEGQPSSLTFVCLDRGLADAASRDGFEVKTWP